MRSYKDVIFEVACTTENEFEWLTQVPIAGEIRILDQAGMEAIRANALLGVQITDDDKFLYRRKDAASLPKFPEDVPDAKWSKVSARIKSTLVEDNGTEAKLAHVNNINKKGNYIKNFGPLPAGDWKYLVIEDNGQFLLCHNPGAGLAAGDRPECVLLDCQNPEIAPGRKFLCLIIGCYNS